MKGQFAMFVKEHYSSVKDLPAKERMKILAEKYRKEHGASEPRLAEQAPKAKTAKVATAKPTLRQAKEKEYKLPLSLVPPSVPVDRAFKKATGVPSSIYSGLPSFNPHEEAIEAMRKTEPKFKVEEGAFIRQGPKGGESDLKTILKMYGMNMPKYMRNVPHGGKLTKKNYSRLFKHVMDTHGKEKGAGFFDGDFLSGFSLPF
jgi:hypothetical protein